MEEKKSEIFKTRCVCCWNEFVLEQSKSMPGPFDIIYYLSCPSCKKAEMKNRTKNNPPL